MWWALAAVLVVGGVITAFAGGRPEGIGAPTPITLAGCALVIAGVALAICEAVVVFYQIGRH